MKNNYNQFIERSKKWVENNKVIKNQLMWMAINFVCALLTLIVLIAIIVSGQTLNITINLPMVFVYGCYLPLGIVGVLLLIIITILNVKKYKKSFFTKWDFYLPILSFAITAIIIPALINAIYTGSMTPAIVWFTLIFAFILFLIASALLINTYFQQDFNQCNNCECSNCQCGDDCECKKTIDAVNVNNFTNAEVEDAKNESGDNETKNGNDVISPDYIISNDRNF